MCGPEELNKKMLIKIRIDLFSILMPVFDVNLLDANCPDRKSKSLLWLLDRLNHNDQLFELLYLHVSHCDFRKRSSPLTFLA